MFVRSFIAAIFTATLISGCGAPRSFAPAAIPGSAIAAMAAEEDLSAEERETLMQVLQSLAPGFADKGAADAPKPDTVGPKGGLLYRALVKSVMLRKAGYRLAEEPVRKHFSKPGKTDDIAPLSASERTELFALLQAGDVIQCGNDGSFVHAIFYEGDGMIVHALAQAGFGKKMIGVRREKLAEYLDRANRDKVVVLRPHWTPEQLDAAVSYARAQVGKDYDPLFLTDADDRHYCTELIFQILNRTGAAKVEPHLAGKVHWRLITNEDIRKTAGLDVVWRRNHD